MNLRILGLLLLHGCSAASLLLDLDSSKAAALFKGHHGLRPEVTYEASAAGMIGAKEQPLVEEQPSPQTPDSALDFSQRTRRRSGRDEPLDLSDEMLDVRDAQMELHNRMVEEQLKMQAAPRKSEKHSKKVAKAEAKLRAHYKRAVKAAAMDSVEEARKHAETSPEDNETAAEWWKRVKAEREAKRKENEQPLPRNHEELKAVVEAEIKKRSGSQPTPTASSSAPEETHDQVRARMEAELRAGIEAELRAKLLEEKKANASEATSTQATDTRKELEKRIKERLKEQLREQVMRGVEPEVDTAAILDQLRAMTTTTSLAPVAPVKLPLNGWSLTARIKAQTGDQAKDQERKASETPERAQIHADISDQLRTSSTPAPEIQRALAARIKARIAEEMEARIKAEISGILKAPETREEMEARIKAEIESQTVAPDQLLKATTTKAPKTREELKARIKA